jgi:hypothetical protein
LEDGLFQADGSGNLTFNNNFRINNSTFGSAFDANGIRLTISGNIDGPGAVSIVDFSGGGGTVVFTGTNTYNGGTTICFCGTLQLGTLATTGSIAGAVTNDGLFNIVNANTAGITSILNEFGGQTTFLNATNATNINITNNTGGTTVFGRPGGTGTSTAGSATIDNDNGGTIFAATSNAGTAKITNHDGGGTIFGDSASAASATITNNNNGFTEFGGNASAASAAITNNNNGFTESLMRSRPRATRSSSPTAVALRLSLTTAPAAMRSS